MKESDLYLPLKSFLEAQGFEVKGEVNDCDLVAVREDEPPRVVEMKPRLNLEVMLQAVDRTRVADRVYVAVTEEGSRRLRSRAARRRVDRMFRMLGLGLITVGFRTPSGRARARPVVEVVIEPAAYAPRKNLKHATALRREFDARLGDHNRGGTTRVRRLTAYRQDALACAQYLAVHGPSAPRRVRDATGITRAGQVLYGNVYGWFERPAQGLYQVNDAGRRALLVFRDVINGCSGDSGIQPGA